ncbi:MAG TPA: ATP-binding protein [Verrucomicrobiae bacterium]|nr:ATP-binding protein [Verrucomicrobiae bacterium]
MSNHTEKRMVLTEEDREQLLEQLSTSERMAELGRLATGIIHELNTPLSVISSAAQLIMREEGLPGGVEELVEMIEREAQRLSQLTRGILTFSRGEGGEAEVNEVLRETLALLRYEVNKRSVLVRETLNDLPLPAALPPHRLKQIFLNLVMNSLHAMEHGGKLLVRTRMRKRFVEVEIRDTGCGIPQEVQERIFDPFFTTKAPGEGTGLGLYVTREIVAAAGGEITVESSPGSGTAFTILLPRAS